MERTAEAEIVRTNKTALPESVSSRLPNLRHVGAREDFCFWKLPLTELAGLVMGVIGVGRTGRRVAELADVLGSRGLLVVAADLAEALNAGTTVAAGLDVLS